MGTEECRVRGFRVWLVAGGIVTARRLPLRRVDRSGRRCSTREYRWTGEQVFRTITQGRDVRRVAKEEEKLAPTRTLAMDWLSRAW